MISPERVGQLLNRYEYLGHQMSQPEAASGDGFVKLSREYSDLGPVVEIAQNLQEKWQERQDLEDMCRDADIDKEMQQMAQDDLFDLKEQIPLLEKKLALALLPKDVADERSAIIEIRAGTGGDEAALFAGDLYRMYEKFAESRGWKTELISASPADVGGFKEIVANVKGKGVFALMKYEMGVHRVQRVPVTESGGRIHTSAATVAVLPEPETVDVVINEQDIRVDTMRSSGAGGQHVNTTDSAVRITHIPSGLVVVQSEKSQHRNREKAMQILRAKLYEFERNKIANERAADRKAQVGSGDRSERVRTYNFPQGRVTDHRISLTLHKLDQVLSGEALVEIVNPLIAEDQAQKLAMMESI